MCSLFLVLSQLQFMPQQEYRLSRKKTENQCLTIREVPVKGLGASVFSFTEIAIFRLGLHFLPFFLEKRLSGSGQQFERFR